MGRNKVPKLSWHPPAELGEWARAEAARRGRRGALSALLTDALTVYRELLPAPAVITVCADVASGRIEVETGDWPDDDPRWDILCEVGGMLCSAADAGPWAEDEEGMGRADEAVRDILGLTVSAWERRPGMNGELFFATVTGRVNNMLIR